MNPLNWFRSKPPKRTLTEKVDNIEAMVYELTDAVDKIHTDLWDKLTAIQEQANQRPSIVLGLPHPDGSMVEGYEPGEYEDFEDFESYGDDSESEVQA